MTKNLYIKCVIWDLDNTIWHGTLVEKDNIVLRENIIDIIDALDKRGILQSIASKNNYDDAFDKLKYYNIENYFLYPQINWNNKSESIKFIKEKINIGFDSIAFIDDQAYERDEVKNSHNDVSCYDVSFINSILELPCFIPKFITQESANRRKLYIADSKRQADEKLFNNNATFLKQLKMSFSISYAKISDLDRVEELTQRTNQLNTTGYTYSYSELRDIIHSDKHKLFVCELTDKYGTYGKIGLAMLEYIEDNMYIRLLLMSCRVVSRGVGSVLLSYIINIACENKKKLYAEFLHTDCNRMMYITYKFAGFEFINELRDKGELLMYKSNKECAYPDYLELNLPD